MDCQKFKDSSPEVVKLLLTKKVETYGDVFDIYDLQIKFLWQKNNRKTPLDQDVESAHFIYGLFTSDNKISFGFYKFVAMYIYTLSQGIIKLQETKDDVYSYLINYGKKAGYVTKNDLISNPRFFAPPVLSAEFFKKSEPQSVIKSKNEASWVNKQLNPFIFYFVLICVLIGMLWIIKNFYWVFELLGGIILIFGITASILVAWAIYKIKS